MSQSIQDKKWLLGSSALEDKPDCPTLFNKSNNYLKQELPSTKMANTPTTTEATPCHTSQAITGSSSNRLAQEIYDEFLVCKICLDGYKNPKCLDCLHTFCETCIETHVNSEPAYKKYSDYREFTCPLCRKRTQLPVGGVKKLPDNFLVSSLTEVVGRQKPPTNPSCDICKLVAKVEREATSKCLDCNKLLCASCVALHKNTKVTSNHSLFDVEIEKEIGCKDHQDEVVRFYCEPCQTCVCVLCTFNEHRDHAISQFQDVALKYKANIEDLLASCKTKIQVLETQLESVNKCESTIKQVEQTIRDKSIEYIQLIRDREKELLEELHQAYGQECFEAIDGKKELIHQVENIRNTCNISEVILLGKEIELLLLKKDVEEKLNLMNEVEAKPLPATIDKNVDFQTGQVDFGYLVHETEGMVSRENVVVRARKVENGKPTSRWMSAVVESSLAATTASTPTAATTAVTVVTKAATSLTTATTSSTTLKERSNVVIKQLAGCYELMETKEHAVQTDPQDANRADIEVEDEDGVVRRRRRKPEEVNK